MKTTIKYLNYATFVIICVLLFIYPAQFMLDDSFFYFQVADNITKGFGSTFNQIVPTNGYHPLWMAFCVISSFIAEGDKELALRIGLLIQVIMTYGIIHYFTKICRKLNIKSYNAAISLLIMFFMSFGLWGSEAFVNSLCFIFAIYYYLNYLDNDKKSTWLIFGIILGLLFLSRLDNALGIIVLGLIIQYREYRTVGLRSISLTLLMFAGFMLIALPYLLNNYIIFGHIVPISGAIKSTFPKIKFDLANLRHSGFIFWIFSIIAVLYGIFVEKDKYRSKLIVMVGTMAFAIPTYVLMFTDGHTGWRWYFVWNYISFAFLFALIADRALKKFDNKNITRYIIISVMILINVYAILFTHSQIINSINPGYTPFYRSTDRIRWQIEFAKNIHNILPAGTRIAVTDFPGWLAYYSELAVFPTDGLINDYRCQDFMSKYGVKAFYKANHIKYFLGPAVEMSRYKLGYWNEVIGKDSVRFRFVCNLHKKDLDSILFTEKDITMRLKNKYPNSDGQDWNLWKINL